MRAHPLQIMHLLLLIIHPRWHHAKAAYPWDMSWKSSGKECSVGWCVHTRVVLVLILISSIIWKPWPCSHLGLYSEELKCWGLFAPANIHALCDQQTMWHHVQKKKKSIRSSSICRLQSIILRRQLDLMAAGPNLGQLANSLWCRRVGHGLKCSMGKRSRSITLLNV